MFTRIRHFSTTWAHEAAQTAQVMGALTNASLQQRVADGYRSLGELAWHVVVSPREIMKHARLEFDAPDRTVPAPVRAAEIHSTYVEAAKAFLRAVESAWTDDGLRERVAFYEASVPRGVVLATTLHHEIHHRGQMTVLMRQSGLEVPGVYGPSKNERD